jgi:gas vesicle protein
MIKFIAGLIIGGIIGFMIGVILVAGDDDWEKQKKN